MSSSGVSLPEEIIAPVAESELCVHSLLVLEEVSRGSSSKSSPMGFEREQELTAIRKRERKKYFIEKDIIK